MFKGRCLGIWIWATFFRLMSSWIIIVSLPLMMVLGEMLLLCHNWFRPCLSAELSSKSQTKRQDETLAMCLPSVQEGQTRWEWMKKRDSFALCEGKGEGRLRIYCQAKCYLFEASQTLVHIVGAHLWHSERLLLTFAIIFMMQIPKGDSGEFTVESTTNVTARNWIFTSHIITLRKNLCAAEDYVA